MRSHQHTEDRLAELFQNYELALRRDSIGSAWHCPAQAPSAETKSQLYLNLVLLPANQNVISIKPEER